MEVVPGVYGVDFDGKVWAYLYRHGPRFTLIDSGIDGRLDVLEAKVRQLGARLADIEQLVLTHAHEDHAGLASELQRLTGVPTLVHVDDAAFVRGEVKIPPPAFSEAEKKLHDQIAPSIPPVLPARVDRELQAGDVIDLDWPAIIVHAPGHTPGSIALYVAERGLLFTGDAVASIGRPMVGIFNIDPDLARQSFRRLSEFRFETACCGHGPPLTVDAAERMREVANSL